MTTTTSTSALGTAGASEALALTDDHVNRGLVGGDYGGEMSVFVGAPVDGQAGIYLTPSDDFIGMFILGKHPSGWQAGEYGSSNTRVLDGDQTLLTFHGTGPLAAISSTDGVTLAVTALVAGSLTMSVVQ